MARLWIGGEKITVKPDSRGRPERFTWQGQAHRIQQVWQQWRVDTDWWSEQGRVCRESWAVTTTDGLLCVLYRDLLAQEWYLEKVYD